MMKLANMASSFNHSRPIRAALPLDVVSLATPIASLYYKFTPQKPFFTAFAVETLKTGSNFDVTSSITDLGFHVRPVEETVADIVAFLRQIYRVDADCVIEQGIPYRKTGDGKKTWMLLGLGTASFGLLHLAAKKR